MWMSVSDVEVWAGRGWAAGAGGGTRARSFMCDTMASAPTGALGSATSGVQPSRTSTAHLPSMVALETSITESPQTTTLETADAEQPTLAAICCSALA